MAVKTLFSKRPPPPPDTSALVPVRGQQVVEEFFSQDKRQRVLILRDDRGIFRVRSFRWCIEDWEVAGRAFWIQEDLGTDVQWNSTNEVVMHVYDYGDGVLESDATKRGIPSNHIATLVFYRDEQTGKFREKR